MKARSLRTFASRTLAVLRRVAHRLGPDGLSLASAGVAFYALLALFPSLTALLSIYGLVADPEDVAAQVRGLQAVFPSEVLRLIEGQLARVAGGTGEALTLGALLSLAFTLWSANRAATAFIQALNIAFQVRETRNVVRKTVLSLALTLCSILGLAAAVALVAGVPGVMAFLGASEASDRLLPILRWPVLMLVICAFSSMLYRWGPNRKPNHRYFFTVGAGAAALMQLVASSGFSWYVSSFGNYNEVYGSVGAVIVVMLWLYLSAFAVLVGAEIDCELEDDRRQA